VRALQIPPKHCIPARLPHVAALRDDSNEGKSGEAESYAVKFRLALRAAGAAARANLLPGLLLQCLMLVFLSLYVSHEGTRAVLAEVARVKGEVGYWFALVSYIIAAALLPEALKVAFFQGGRVTRENARSLAAAVPIWGTMGVLVDLFYRLQVVWFGAGSDFLTITKKVVVDQSDRKLLSAHRDVRPEFEAGSGFFHSWMLADRGLSVKRPSLRDAGRAPHHVMTGPAG